MNISIIILVVLVCFNAFCNAINQNQGMQLQLNPELETALISMAKSFNDLVKVASDINKNVELYVEKSIQNTNVKLTEQNSNELQTEQHSPSDESTHGSENTTPTQGFEDATPTESNVQYTSTPEYPEPVSDYKPAQEITSSTRRITTRKLLWITTRKKTEKVPYIPSKTLTIKAVPTIPMTYRS